MLSRTARRWLRLPPAEWGQALCYQREAKTDYDALCKEFDALATQAALLSGYLSQREGLGNGPKSHAAAVLQANKRLVKVRRALGFSCPEGGTFEF